MKENKNKRKQTPAKDDDDEQQEKKKCRSLAFSSLMTQLRMLELPQFSVINVHDTCLYKLRWMVRYHSKLPKQ